MGKQVGERRGRVPPHAPLLRHDVAHVSQVLCGLLFALLLEVTQLNAQELYLGLHFLHPLVHHIYRNVVVLLLHPLDLFFVRLQFSLDLF